MRQGKELKVKMMFDRHVHFRWGDLMSAIAPYTFRQCSGAIIKPNTKPIINSIEIAKEYKKQIDFLVLQERTQFAPYLTLYLTNNTDIDELKRGYKEGVWIAGKLYPAGATTNADNWVNDIENIYPIFEKMQNIGMPLLMHCEKVDTTIDFFDRERIFIKDTMPALITEFPELKIVVEHVSTKEAVSFVIQNSNVWATVTPHHLMKNSNAMFENGFDPTYFCYPLLNSEEDRQIIISAVMSGVKEIREKFGAGSDSAPHYPESKIKIGGDGGMFTASTVTQAYTQVFVENNAKLGYLNDFLAVNLLKDVYGISSTRELHTTLVKEEWKVPEKYSGIRPFMAGETLQWKIKSQTGR